MQDYGSDPLGDGKHRMIPSGDIVDAAERAKRLPKRTLRHNECLGLSWNEIERMQGGKIRHDK